MTDGLRVDDYNVRQSALDLAQRGYIVEAARSTEEILARAESYLAFLMTGKAPVKAAVLGQHITTQLVGQSDSFPLRT